MADQPASHGGGEFLLGCILICLTLIFWPHIQVELVRLSFWWRDVQQGIQAWLAS